MDKIAEGAKTAASGTESSDAIGGAPVTGQDAAPADIVSVNVLVKGIKEIVGVVLKDNEGNAEATKTAENEKKSIGKLFSGGKDNDGTDAQAAVASASVLTFSYFPFSSKILPNFSLTPFIVFSILLKYPPISLFLVSAFITQCLRNHIPKT
ncbi:Variable outer membrane protein (plasmid) [Borrelia crocidurae DOU]|uniref:Variable large protein n=1 Tax=Borrelia crocidurae DOU TaxID=1293575 RepID=W5SL03_9SPIR|nr:Variable outer membrane protein [Borrelia crocidurae DOU]